jgi:hypothetical protein
MPLMNPLHPPASVLAKIGSILVHVEEYGSPGGHPFDSVAAANLMADQEVQDWLLAMADLALLPKKRS